MVKAPLHVMAFFTIKNVCMLHVMAFFTIKNVCLHFGHRLMGPCARAQVVADMRELKQRQWYAALRMQGLWYKYKRQYPTFVLLASLREFDKAEAELAALVIRRQADACTVAYIDQYLDSIWLPLV